MPLQTYQEHTYNMKSIAKPDFVLGEPYSQTQWGVGHDNFAGYLTQEDAKAYQGLTSTGIDMTSSATSSFGQSQVSYTDPAFPIYPGYGNGYGIYSSADSHPFDGVDIPDSNMSMKGGWWPEVSSNATNEYENNFVCLSKPEGLQTTRGLQNRQHDDFWPASSSSESKRLPSAAGPATISPKLLTLDVISPPMSLSGSSHGSSASHSSSCETSSEEDGSEWSSPESSTATQQSRLLLHGRRLIPRAMHKPPKKVPVLASAFSSNLVELKSNDYESTKGTSSSRGSARKAKDAFKSHHRGSQKSLGHQKIEPKPPSPTLIHDWADQPQSATTAQAIHYWDSRDDFLVKSKLAGMSYKEIRRKGGFSEAESTLRGRFRTLTKAKSARVRKPEWNDNDVSSYHLSPIRV
ncbi:hypothetical protein BGZ60DRAFT_69897 [Tricladium varicosporioides]|nr:hypothetical protein BGZ60DRAFT_69897 [Hymenoscyphus varicosporioides]